MLELNKIYCMDCLEGMKQLEDNSIDSIVTDPPYELGFMGKKWDSTGIAYNVEVWKQCLRVLKSGGHLLSFGGTRTYHRMACAIEDAGFEIRDQMQWLYGCLSEDTDILTPYGWERYNKTKHLNSNIPILIYDVENNFYKWEKPKGWSEYSLNKDTCYRIKSDTTDQLVSRNHRCLVKREGKLIFIKAEELQEVEYMPTLSDNFSILSERQRELLQSSMLWKSKNLVEELFSKWFGQEMSEQRNENGKESCLERGSDLLQEERELWKIQNQICEMSRAIYQYGEKGWLCNGTPIDNGETFEKEFIENRSDTSQRPQSREQQDRELNSIQEQQGTQNTRGYGITKAKIAKEEYSGMIFCPSVSTGCFVARRNGKIFITGNSGFPKSLNIGKAIDKLQGNERVIGNYRTDGRGKWELKMMKQKGDGDTGIGHADGSHQKYYETKGNSKYEGWGTALKPANEPICVARKPLSEKNVALNCLKYGTGGINIDGCRINYDKNEDLGDVNRFNGTIPYPIEKGWNNNKLIIQNYDISKGRFPANIILDEEAGKMLDEQSGIKCGQLAPTTGKEPSASKVNAIYNDYSMVEGKPSFPKDKLGGASRFFYCAKASKSERNNGCEGLESKLKLTQMRSSNGTGDKNFSGGFQDQIMKNPHPTVKPIKLMRYLCRLVTPKNGIVLDPFSGSGTTCISAKLEGFKSLGFEISQEYVNIANKRLNAIPQRLDAFIK